MPPMHTTPTHCDILPSPSHLNPTSTPPEQSTNHVPQPLLSMMEWLICNSTFANNTLWTPNTLSWHHTVYRTIEQSQLHTHPYPFDHTTSTFPLPVTALHSANNTSATCHGIVSSTPALKTHFPWQATCQCHNWHPIQLHWATTMVPGLNLWPPYMTDYWSKEQDLIPAHPSENTN